ncbi:MAG: prevent-host-death protein [Treponema sp.]|nr:prevent-host-death protein [Treponema sp.]
MIQMTVGDFKAQFSSLLDQVIRGEEVQILYGRAKTPVAQLSQIVEKPKKKRPIGLYNNLGPVWEDENFEFEPQNLFDDMDDLL